MGLKIVPMENYITVLLFCFSFTSIFIISVSLDTISPNETIKDGETIVSANGNFELGFFRPGASKYRYLGVWYRKVSNGTVVWVANRETPLTDSSGLLKLNEKGLLVLLNQKNTTIWFSNTSSVMRNPVVQLLDSGNLVIRAENDLDPQNFIWQSFDYPDKTLLPGMKIGTTAKGLDIRISSWKSEDDPSPGNFTYQLDPSVLQIVVKENSDVKYRYGPWNGVQFSGLPYSGAESLNYTFVFNQKEAYYSFDELVNQSIVTRLVLNDDGKSERFIWIDRTSAWSRYISGPTDICDDYALCGAYGICDTRKSPLCSCLDRFMPKYRSNWNGGDWLGGCDRRMQLDCQKGDKFIRYFNVKLPDMKNSSTNASLTLEECKMLCLKDCSCMAYAVSDIKRGRGCFFWFGDLLDIKQLTEHGQDLYIRMSSSEIDDEDTKINGKSKIKIITAILSVTGAIILGLALAIFVRKRKQRKYRNLERSANNNNKNEDLELPLFDLGTIASATNNFSFTNKIGKGGFGPVYMGVLKNGQEVAVKRLSANSEQGVNEFKNEVVYIAKLQHRNLVKLLGCCIQANEMMLIYEFLPNKSLDFFIFDERDNMLLDWPKRFHIINGIARGLLYLHQDSRLRIVHRDLKASNILLDNEMNPKISDFGLARSFGGNETEKITKKVAGTYGYMSPEYAIDGLYSVKSDVFSFGVMVLEIVSGKRNRGFYHPDHNLNLLGHAWTLHKEGRSIEMIDTLARNSCNLSEVVRLIHVGLLCVQRSSEDRPSMSTVVFMLGSEGALPQPKQPGFFNEREITEANSSSDKDTSFSTN
ncbi:hypothetical protein JCGZ_00740 [Jatropha curcas]|uniref:Receptor-like serine/threonine-protein kinase n=1 Tax=Jatropha curcas TaxID=180498 RepID=A0A067KVG0_JATCU|nr:hypothetical protein JCGZ_00740 [Jatropha curcas]